MNKKDGTIGESAIAANGMTIKSKRVNGVYWFRIESDIIKTPFGSDRVVRTGVDFNLLLQSFYQGCDHLRKALPQDFLEE